MTSEEEKKKQDAARTVRELYLYPYRTKGENVLRYIAWTVSWLVGIAIQSAEDPKTLGGAYLIFASSLLLEFLLEGRTRPKAIVAHGAFCTLLLGMLIGAFVVIFGEAAAADGTPYCIYTFSLCALPVVGWIIFFVMLIAVVLTIFEVHKLIYDEKGQAEQDIEQERERQREIWKQNAAGAPGGGERQ